MPVHCLPQNTQTDPHQTHDELGWFEIVHFVAFQDDRYIANTDIPIYSKEKLNDIENKENIYIVIMAWNYADTIINKLKKNFSNFIVPFPNVYIINN